MRQIIFTLIILTFLFNQVVGQIDSGTVYKNLPIRKYYPFNVNDSYREGGEIKYLINNTPVSKSIYQKYMSTAKNFGKCKPCILKSYNINDTLISEAVIYRECGVGAFKEYYPNGKLKRVGQYKENPTGKWKYVFDSCCYCGVEEGKWTYFSDKGDTLYSEYWEDAIFIKQEPEQKTSEIWWIKLMLYGEIVSNQELLPNQLKDLVIIPEYKNSSRDSTNLEIKFEIVPYGYSEYERQVTVKSFKDLDIQTLFKDNGIKPKKTAYFITVYNNGKEIASRVLNVKY